MKILDVLEKKGFPPVSTDYFDMIPIWDSWYRGKVKGFHNYKVYNGQKHIICERYSLGMGKQIAEDWADYLMNERVKITLEGEAEQSFADRVFRENNFVVKCNEMQEKKAALGAAAYVMRVDGVAVDDNGYIQQAESLKIDYVVNGNIIPLRWENGVVIDCAFTSRVAIKKDKYLYMQIHRLGESGYIIENSIYKDNEGGLTEVPLTSVAGYEKVPPVVHTNSTVKQFVIDRLNIANNVDPNIPLGVPAFANAIDQLKGVDTVYDSYVNEFDTGKKRIMVKPEATKTFDGEPLFDANDVVFYVLPEDSQNDTIIKEVDMNLRADAHSKGIQDMLHTLSLKCGFGENHFKFENGAAKTATEVIAENSKEFRTLKKHEIILHDVLVELCRTILRMGNQYLNAGLNEAVEISIDFDDSIIEDTETDFARDARMVNMGVLDLWEFRAKWMNEDKATAKAALPKAEALVSNAV